MDIYDPETILEVLGDGASLWKRISETADGSAPQSYCREGKYDLYVYGGYGPFRVLLLLER